MLRVTKKREARWRSRVLDLFPVGSVWGIWKASASGTYAQARRGFKEENCGAEKKRRRRVEVEVCQGAKCLEGLLGINL